MAVAWCINAYDCSWNLIRTLEQLQSSNIGVWVQYTAPNPLDDKKINYIKYTDKCGYTCTLSWENEILIYSTNWVIKNLSLTNDDTNEKVIVKWNDIFWSNWLKTVVRYKTGSAPTSLTDWTLAVEETTKNQYATNGYWVSWLSDDTTYYFSVFGVDTDGTVINVQSRSIKTDFGRKPNENTLAYYKFEWNANDYSWNGLNLSSYWNVSYTTLNWKQVVHVQWSSTGNSTKLISWTITKSTIPSTFAIWVQTNSTSWQYANKYSLINFFATNPQFSRLWIGTLQWNQSWKYKIWKWFENMDETWVSPYINDWKFHLLVATISSTECNLYVDWTKVYTWNWTTNWTFTWNFIVWWNDDNYYWFNWYIWETIWEDVIWDNDFQQKYYNKTKSQYWY